MGDVWGLMRDAASLRGREKESPKGHVVIILTS